MIIAFKFNVIFKIHLKINIILKCIKYIFNGLFFFVCFFIVNNFILLAWYYMHFKIWTLKQNQLITTAIKHSGTVTVRALLFCFSWGGGYCLACSFSPSQHFSHSVAYSFITLSSCALMTFRECDESHRKRERKGRRRGVQLDIRCVVHEKSTYFKNMKDLSTQFL